MNSRLLIPAVVAACAILGLGNIVYNFTLGSMNDISSSTDDFSFVEDENVDTGLTQIEIEDFNDMFLLYEGTQSGSNIKNLISKLISNVHTYRSVEIKVPQVYIDKISELNSYNLEITFGEESDFQEYMDNLNTIRNLLEQEHEYYVEITYQENGLIDYIQISYDLDNPMFEQKNRE